MFERQVLAMATIFVAPLFKVEGFESDSPLSVFKFPENIMNSIAGFETTRNGNAINICISDRESSESASVHIQSWFPEVAVKLKVEAEQPKIEKPVACDDPSVPSGLRFIKDWLTENEEDRLIRQIDEQEWETTVRRRVQHYGFQFKYSQLNVDSDKPVRDFPQLVNCLITQREEIACFGFDQLTINEYPPGIGIASHCDTHSAFIDTIAVVSLLNPITMDFVMHDNSRKVSVIIPPRSLMLMEGESRYGWRHAIASRKTDVDTNGTSIPRQRRVSLTFRKIDPHECSCLFANLCDTQGADKLRPRRMQSG